VYTSCNFWVKFGHRKILAAWVGVCCTKLVLPAAGEDCVCRQVLFFVLVRVLP
jgi:hypothetical protein